MRLMTDEELIKCKALLDYFNVDYSAEVIKLTSGGNSVILNPGGQWSEFVGYSINAVAEAVARKLGKKTISVSDY